MTVMKLLDYDEIELELVEAIARFDNDSADFAEAYEALDIIRKELAGSPVQTSGLEEEVWEPHDDEPLTIFQACCLPEFGGRLYRQRKGISGNNIKARQLLDEIEAGRLKRVPPFRNGKFFVSRATIREWKDTAWQDDVNHRGSSLRPSDRTGTARSKSQSGSSNITTRTKDALVSSARDLALMKLQRLKNASRNG
ncbi:hypothetical protein CN128_09800 [Sinorhizobium meliloti]|uniref:hypothetical protein n=1 Tax=Rhizobium meliloti TaxID=382 RepID=UPI000FD87555|nr:hypothetical protein [Sinorhizobium meliloti]RVM58376.1 hypothetical protein CN128_09800 [Sinorhizobium meliloti]